MINSNNFFINAKQNIEIPQANFIAETDEGVLKKTNEMTRLLSLDSQAIIDHFAQKFQKLEEKRYMDFRNMKELFDDQASQLEHVVAERDDLSNKLITYKKSNAELLDKYTEVYNGFNLVRNTNKNMNRELYDSKFEKINLMQENEYLKSSLNSDQSNSLDEFKNLKRSHDKLFSENRTMKKDIKKILKESGKRFKSNPKEL